MRATIGLIFFAATLIIFTALTGTADAIDPSAIQESAALPIPLRDLVGQTFISRYPRLHSIQVRWAAPNDNTLPRGASVTLHLRASPTAEADLASVTIPLDQIHPDDFSKFTFAPIPDSQNQSYYFFFDPLDRAGLWSSGEDAYAGGALYVNHTPTPRDLSFRAYYEPNAALLARALVDTVVRFRAHSIIFLLVVLFAFYFSIRQLSVFFRAALMATLLGALGVALLQVRDLPAPLWVDSLTHAQYVQFILAHTSLPFSNFYHLGFHALTAIISRLLSLSIAESILFTGQLSWALGGVGIFFFSRRVSGSDLAGMVSAVCVWFLSPTPAYFITWGRYPLLLGSAFLPFALVSTIKLLQERNKRNVLLASITLAALAFTHIRLTAFYLVFILIYFGVSFRASLTARKRSNVQRGFIDKIKIAASPGTGSLNFFIAFAIALLWLALWFTFLLSRGVTPQSVLAENQAAPSIDLQTAFEVAMTHHGPELALLAGLSAIVGLGRRSPVALLMLGWALTLGVLTLIPPIVGELVPPSLVLLMAFLPAVVLVGEAAQFAYDRWRSPNPIVRAAVWVALIGGVGIFGARDMINVANPATILFASADDRAMKWINENISRNARFLVNSFNWVDSAFLPADGGGWIPYFTANPIEFIGAEQSDSESVLSAWIMNHRIDYIYIGTRGGVLSASEFQAHPERFELIYDQQVIKIFRVKRN